MSQPPAHRRQLVGVVVSDKMKKTVVVRVEQIKTHPRYGKQYRLSAKFKAHDEAGQYHLGDRVQIEETRPISAHKRWRIVKKLGLAGGSKS
ncbi:MAG: 30S ribosomal protein S17 [Candidatus Kerfeldbacteria bacterium]|nr:30S ribosomal protein S17 [Candidatus Kerfeldbacteria bacterium]